MSFSVQVSTSVARAADVLEAVFSRPLEDDQLTVPPLKKDRTAVLEDEIAQTRKVLENAPDETARLLAEHRLKQLKEGKTDAGVAAWAIHRNSAPPKAEQLPVSKNFKLVFLTVAAITVACGITYVVMAFLFQKFTTPQESAFESVGFAWKVGVGAIFGLLGGKAT